MFTYFQILYQIFYKLLFYKKKLEKNGQWQRLQVINTDSIPKRCKKQFAIKCRK